MVNRKDRILFFASGDFAYDTLANLITNEYNVVGLVTTNYTPHFKLNTLEELARTANIDVFHVKPNIDMETDEWFLNWLNRHQADIFCVISFKKLPSNIYNMAKKCAFNVHASLLPLLRGAAPINWAVRLGYDVSGLTAFVLDEKIDTGKIIANTPVKLSKKETFTNLFNKMANECVDFSANVIDNFLTDPNWKDKLISQPIPSDVFDYLAPAPKITRDYFNAHWTRFTAKDAINAINSVDDTGWSTNIVILDLAKPDEKLKVLEVKIWEAEAGEHNDIESMGFGEVHSDGKTYIRVDLVGNECIFIKKLQLVGKKPMDVESFLNGFRYLNGDNKYKVTFAPIGFYDDEQDS